MEIFALPIFFITFRESLETAIIVSVLLALVKRTLGDGSSSNQDEDAELQRRMIRQVWLGTFAGLAVCILMGVLVIAGANGLGVDEWAVAEDVWEGAFALLASVIITAMGAVLLRVSRLQDKWRDKLLKAFRASSAGRDDESSAGDGAESPRTVKRNRFLDRLAFLGEEYSLFLLPFITVLREGFEGVIFIAGVGLGYPVSALIFTAAVGLLAGAVFGYAIYNLDIRGSNFASMQKFLAASTCFLYLVAAGLFSKGVWHLEANEWNKIVGGDAAELGSGPGSYDITKSVWHVNCCNPDFEGGGLWGVFNSILGWTNSATVGSVVSYNLYWIVVSIGFLCMAHKEKTGHYPFLQRASKITRSVLDGDRQPLLSNARTA
ncbi:plasma membrane iron permease [Pyricularia oryzae]|uniref:Plasma membrane iron permease n=2 Tax=Pyricularia oryzae TaxID=318829 RepID=A0AA97NTK6_PYRO3|nr:plasma membrane iron permease [Pyricularia oryzae Y34]KAI7910536.1 plasma membrane iron permease [Pyricularia oryzae]KAI7911293.1 plasma membrane iron permease [Pyricularia oryzae]